jgi:hypothetical protein
LFIELARVSSVLHDLVVERGDDGQGQRHECHQQMCKHEVGTKDLRVFFEAKLPDWCYRSMQEHKPDWPATIYSDLQAFASVWLRLSLSWIVMRRRTDKWSRNVGKQLWTYSAQHFRRAKDFSFIIFAAPRP